MNLPLQISKMKNVFKTIIFHLLQQQLKQQEANFFSKEDINIWKEKILGV